MTLSLPTSLLSVLANLEEGFDFSFLSFSLIGGSTNTSWVKDVKRVLNAPDEAILSHLLSLDYVTALTYV